jgi:hypothetical protein
VTEGYYWTIGNDAGWSRLVLADAAGACTEVVAGDVVLRNAPAFNAASGAVASYVLELYLPPGYLRMQLITKVRSATATVKYDVKARAEGWNDMPLDLGAWFRPVWLTTKG